MIFLKLFFYFIYIGLFTIGGGYAMIPLVQEVVVLNNNWITAVEFQEMIGLSECTPGPIALNMATFVGARQAGFFGGLCATLGVVIPSFVIICILAALLSKVSNNLYLKGTLRGASFVAMGLVASIAVTMLLQTTTNFDFKNMEINWLGIKILGISLICFIILWIIRKKKPGPLVTIGMSVVVGLLVGYLWK